jgi:hypothetical protein
VLPTSLPTNETHGRIRVYPSILTSWFGTGKSWAASDQRRRKIASRTSAVKAGLLNPARSSISKW